MATSAYIHIPFCRRRCFYCDFAISVVGDRKRGDTSPTIEQYVHTLIQEIQATPIAISETGTAPLQTRPLKTVFFGGGTPSLLAVSQLEAILQAIDQRFGIAPDAEVSMEMDPATFELAHIQGYRAAGINRVSLGVQDFEDEVLAACGRFHRQGDILHAVDLLRQANVNNFSLDLISGLPHQTLESWQKSLTKAIELQPHHISQYDLIVEPQTAFSRYFTPGEAPLPSDDHTTAMYRMAKTMLNDNGYEHYEICNYAKPGYQAKHNLTYWKNQPCYGFGMGATSYLWKELGPGYQRIDRPRTQRSYRDWVAQFVKQGQTDDPVLSPGERVLEGIMVGLRLKEGVSLAALYEVYGEPGLVEMGKAIAPHISSQWVTITSATGTSTTDCQPYPNVTNLKPTDHIRLTDPEGFLMSNVVIVDAFNALEALRTDQ
ncbi:MAG: radical SAM family heme chaperone HemW [Cyanobacteria bacterium P01_F01_bin.53]